MKVMEKKLYNKPEVLTVKVDCDIVMQTQSDELPGPGEGQGGLGGEEGVTPFINPLKWFK
jgi:hypothetical protein